MEEKDCLCGIPLEKENFDQIFIELQFLNFSRTKNLDDWEFNGIPVVPENLDRIVEELKHLKQTLNDALTEYSHPNAIAHREARSKREAAAIQGDK